MNPLPRTGGETVQKTTCIPERWLSATFSVATVAMAYSGVVTGHFAPST